MKKYTAQIARPCNLHSASEQAKNWSETMEMRIVVTDQGRVWVKKERHLIGVLNTKPAGGSWERHNVSFSKRITVDQWLAQVGAVEADFKGGPRGVV